MEEGRHGKTTIISFLSIKRMDLSCCLRPSFNYRRSPELQLLLATLFREIVRFYFQGISD